MGYVVTDGYVTAETAIEGGARARVDIPRGAALPADVPAAEVQALLALGQIAPVVESEPEPEPVAPVVDPDAVPEGTAAVLMAWVDGDKDKAARALAAEQAKDGGGRSTVVAALTKLVEA